MPKVFTGDGEEVAAFVAIHGGFSGLYVAGGAGLDLDEAEDILMPGDQIDFAASIGRAEIGATITYPSLRR